jgi:hypothetical protein
MPANTTPTLNSSRPARRLPPVQGTLALDLPMPGLPVHQQPGLRLVPGGSQPGTANDILPAQAWANQFVRAVLEVIDGDRPVQQLVRWTDRTVYDDLQRRVRVLGEAGNGPGRSRADRCQLRSVHVSQPMPDVAEVAARVRHRDRSRAIAVRFEAARGRWVCTALQFG